MSPAAQTLEGRTRVLIERVFDLGAPFRCRLGALVEIPQEVLRRDPAGFLSGGSADLTAIDRSDDGASTSYTFMGSFAPTRDQLPAAGLPVRGEVVATISVWADATLYQGSMELHDLAQ